MPKDLLLIGNEVMALQGVAGDGGASHRQFDAEIEFDGGIDDGIEAEDFLLPIGILRVAAHSDPGIEIGRQLGAAKEEGVVAVVDDDFGEDSAFDNEVEPHLAELIFEAENGVEHTGVLRICFPQGEGEHFDLGSFLVLGESGGRAFDFDADIFAGDDVCWVLKSIGDSAPDVVDDAFELDELAVRAEIGAAFVTGVGGEKGSVGSDDLVGDKPEQFDDLNEDMEDTVIQFLTQAFLEVREGCFARNIAVVDAGIDTIVFSPHGITEHGDKRVHIGEFFEIAEKIEQEEADRVIGQAEERIPICHDGSNEGKIDQGSNEAGKAAGNAAIGMDFDVAAFISVAGQPKALGLGEWPAMGGVDSNEYTVEFLDHTADGKGRQIPQTAILLKIEDPVMGQDSFNGPFMKGEFENFADQLRDGSPREGELCSLIDDEPDDFRSDLIRLSFPHGFRGKAGEALGAESLQGLIKGFSGVTELSAGFRNETTFVAMGAKHLILDLRFIGGVEKIGLLKQIGLDGFIWMLHGIPHANG